MTAARLLVVDDEPDLRTLYELTLLREGYEIDSAGSVAEALALLQAGRYSAVITDMKLPDGSGLALLRWLEQAGRPEKALVITAFGLAPMPGSLLALGVIPLAGLLFAAIGVSFTLRVPSMDLFSFYFTLFLTPLFLFSDVFFPIEERLTGVWLVFAELLPLLHPVRLARDAFHGTLGWVALWDLAYILGVSAVLLRWSAGAVRERLTS